MSERNREKETFSVDVEERFPRMFRGLEQISPKTSKTLNSKVNFRLLLSSINTVAPSTASISQADRLNDAINIYKKAVDDTIRGEKQRNYLIDIVVVAITLALIAVSAIFSNTEGIATTTGVSGVTILAQAKASADISKAYNHDATKLKNSVSILQSRLAGCDPNNKTCLDEVKELIDKAFNALII